MNLNGSQTSQYMSEDDFEDYKHSSQNVSSSVAAAAAVLTSSASYYSQQQAPALGGPGISSAGLPIASSSGLAFASSSSSAPAAASSSQSQSQGSSSSRNQICCLVDDGKRCNRYAGNASYSKRIQKTVYYKRLKLEHDANASHIYICDYHKVVIQNARTRPKKDSEDEMNDGDGDVPEVDLFQLQVNTLRRYKKHYKISSRPGLNKTQLADVLTRHFKQIPVMEKETVAYFIYMIKSEKNKLDNPTRGNNDSVGNGGNSEMGERWA